MAKWWEKKDRGDFRKVAEDAASDTGGIASDADLASIRENFESSRQAKRESKPRSKERPQRVDDLAQKEIDALFKAENWEALASLYFDARFAMTGFEGFPLSEGQRKQLGSTLGTTMRILLAIDPAYIALIVFGVNYGGLIAAKEAGWAQHKAKLKVRAAQPSQVQDPSKRVA